MPETKEISAELLALTHQIELSKSDWWDQTIQQLTLSVLYIKKTPITVNETIESLRLLYKLNLTNRRVENCLNELSDKVIKNKNKYSLAHKTRSTLAELIKETIDAESQARNHFLETAKNLGIEEDTQELWAKFNDNYLIPLITQIGAQTYNLINGINIERENSILQNFLRPFSNEDQSKLKECAASFFDPSHNKTKKYVIRLLHARLCIDAGGLTEYQLTEINNNRDIHWRLYVDTNFLFSILGFHENPSNDVALELCDIAKQLTTSPRVSFLVTSETLEEAITLLDHEKKKLSKFYRNRVLVEAASGMHIMGIPGRIIKDQSKGYKGRPEDWINLRINNLHSYVQSSGIEIINTDADNCELDNSTKEDVATFYSILWDNDYHKDRTEEVVKHDVRLWRFVKDKRPLGTEQFSKNNDWIITLDKYLLKFDQKKRQELQSNAPICLTPEEAIHLLQFWIPRTEAFEEAILGSLRQPFLFHDFDIEAEKTTLRILDGISIYENTEDMSKEMIVQVAMNEALRATIEKTTEPEAEEELIRDALIKENSAKNKILSEEIASLKKALESKREKDLLAEEEEKTRKEQQQEITENLKVEVERRKQLEERYDALKLRIRHYLAPMPGIVCFVALVLYDADLFKWNSEQLHRPLLITAGSIIGIICWTIIQPRKNKEIIWVAGIICTILGGLLVKLLGLVIT